MPPAAMSSPPKAWSTVLIDIGVDYDGAKTEVEVHDGDRLPLGFDLEGCPSRGSATCGR